MMYMYVIVVKLPILMHLKTLSLARATKVAHYDVMLYWHAQIVWRWLCLYMCHMEDSILERNEYNIIIVY